MFKAMKILNDKQLELAGKQSALERDVNRVKGTLNDIKGDLSQVMKLATETQRLSLLLMRSWWRPYSK